MTSNKESGKCDSLNRRQFLVNAGASALAFSLAQPAAVLGAEPAAKINVGLIGCGGRGQWIAGLFVKHGGYNFVAAADYFQDRVDGAAKALGIPAERCFTGLSGYKRLLEQKLDAVVIESPPHFHPEQVAAAIAADKHVYLAKPAAVDVPGCLSIEASGKRAREKKRVFLVDFQTRTHQLYKDCAERIKHGDLGDIISAEAAYQTGLVREEADNNRRADPKNLELRLRAWVTDRVLSGDIITEQNIHALDLACWMLDAAPLRAYGTGGKRRPYVGDCWDHFSVTFYFPKDVVLTFNSKQAGFAMDDIMCRVYGMMGTVDAHYAGRVSFKSREEVFSGEAKGLYATGAEANIATFYDNITKGNCDNPTVAPSVRSNLTTILGRSAAYKRSEVTWEEMMRRRERFESDLRGLKV